MKRKESPLKDAPAAKKAKTEADYHLTPSVAEEDGSIQWPAPRVQIERAREVIMQCAEFKAKTLIVPDKDADGLTAGAILRHTLMLLGLPKESIDVHLISKGNSVHTEEERKLMAAYEPDYVFVLDQGSRPGPPVIDGTHQALIIDHHAATSSDFPQDSDHINACESPPVATSSLLTYLLCEPLHPGVKQRCDWLCVVGTTGDLGASYKWESPFPDLNYCLKTYSKKTLNDVVALVNAPRRTATRDVRTAWDALCDTDDPKTILKNPRLIAARQDISEEVERCTHTPPKFSKDGRVAAFRISSGAQVHPLIATRWAGHLKAKALEMILVANEGYLPGKVNFSCRIVRSARDRDPPVSIIANLKDYASRSMPVEDDDNMDTSTEHAERVPLLERLGVDFARGHVQASGGIVDTADFEELMKIMQIGVKPDKKDDEDRSPAKPKKRTIDSSQKNNLMSYFAKPKQASEAKA